MFRSEEEIKRHFNRNANAPPDQINNRKGIISIDHDGDGCFCDSGDPLECLEWNRNFRRDYMTLGTPQKAHEMELKKALEKKREATRVTKPKKEKRETYMGFFATESEKNAIEKNAELQGKSISAFLRDRGARPDFTNNETAFLLMNYMGEKFGGIEEICSFSITGGGTSEQPIVRVKRNSRGTPSLKVETTGLSKKEADILQKNFGAKQLAAKEMMEELKRVLEARESGTKILKSVEEARAEESGI